MKTAQRALTAPGTRARNWLMAAAFLFPVVGSLATWLALDVEHAAERSTLSCGLMLAGFGVLAAATIAYQRQLLHRAASCEHAPGRHTGTPPVQPTASDGPERTAHSRPTSALRRRRE